MELKDYISFILLGITIVISLISLFISLKNRRNALREHLYKQQLDFMMKIFAQLTEIYFLFEDICVANEYDDKMYNDKIQKKIDDLIELIHKETALSMILLPEHIDDLLETVISEIRELALKIDKNQGEITSKDLSKLEETYDELLYAKREVIGIEPLTRENMGLFGNSVKWKKAIYVNRQ